MEEDKYVEILLENGFKLDSSDTSPSNYPKEKQVYRKKFPDGVHSASITKVPLSNEDPCRRIEYRYVVSAPGFFNNATGEGISFMESIDPEDMYNSYGILSLELFEKTIHILCNQDEHELFLVTRTSELLRKIKDEYYPILSLYDYVRCNYGKYFDVFGIKTEIGFYRILNIREFYHKANPSSSIYFGIDYITGDFLIINNKTKQVKKIEEGVFELETYFDEFVIKDDEREGGIEYRYLTDNRYNLDSAKLLDLLIKLKFEWGRENNGDSTNTRHSSAVTTILNKISKITDNPEDLLPREEGFWFSELLDLYKTVHEVYKCIQIE